MTLSLYSLCMALLSSWAIIWVLKLIFRNPAIAYKIHPDFLTILVWIFFLRMFLPCSFLIGIPLPWNSWFYELERFLDSFTFLSINGFGWLNWIWLAGALFTIVKQRIAWNKQGVLCDLLLKDSVHRHISDFLPDYIGPDYDVYVCPNVQSSFVMGRSRRILIPDDPMTPEEYEFVLLHEAGHINNDDIAYLRAVKLLRILYWWFPPINKITPTMDLFYEIRVDLTVNANRSAQARLDYSRALLRFSSPSSKYIRQKDPAYAQAFSVMAKEPLESRIHFLLNTNFEKPLKTHPLILVIPYLMAFLSSLLLVSTEVLP